MAGRGLAGRITDLEERGGAGRPGSMVWVIREPGQSADEAIACHESAHGPIVSSVLMWNVVTEISDGETVACA